MQCGFSWRRRSGGLVISGALQHRTEPLADTHPSVLVIFAPAERSATRVAASPSSSGRGVRGARAGFARIVVLTDSARGRLQRMSTTRGRAARRSRCASGWTSPRRGGDVGRARRGLRLAGLSIAPSRHGSRRATDDRARTPSVRCIDAAAAATSSAPRRRLVGIAAPPALGSRDADDAFAALLPTAIEQALAATPPCTGRPSRRDARRAPRWRCARSCARPAQRRTAHWRGSSTVASRAA